MAKKQAGGKTEMVASEEKLRAVRLELPEDVHKLLEAGGRKAGHQPGDAGPHCGRGLPQAKSGGQVTGSKR